MLPFPALLLLFGAVLILQSTVLGYIAVYGIKPDLILLLAVFNGFLLGPRQGAFLGFAAGAVTDLFTGSYIGLNAISKMVAGYLAGICGERFYQDNALVLSGITFVCSIAGLLVDYLMLLSLGIQVNIFYGLFRVILPAALYTAVLVPILYGRVFRYFKIKGREL
ncbi:MAG: rod shape-determining protein MreD [Pelotomaculum sp. PtaB.Bin104]|nr:MAG: rod shape-determining protein MreD [Pelotomaculum sp. PtaB.Bin104]